MISGSIYDMPNLTAVPVIASFSEKGELRPLYFGYEHESIKILSYKITGTQTFNTRFQCEYENYGTRKQVELYYNDKTRTWFIDTAKKIS